MPPKVDVNTFKQAQRGLYAGKTRLTGNHVSPSKRHVKRAWLPNVQRKALWSDLLGRSISLNVTTAALRNIDRLGGLDEYILNTPPSKLASEKGEALRRQLNAQLKQRWLAAATLADEAALTAAPAGADGAAPPAAELR